MPIRSSDKELLQTVAQKRRHIKKCVQRMCYDLNDAPMLRLTSPCTASDQPNKRFYETGASWLLIDLRHISIYGASLCCERQGLIRSHLAVAFSFHSFMYHTSKVIKPVGPKKNETRACTSIYLPVLLESNGYRSLKDALYSPILLR